jgi:PAS domain S-box-containing protein
MAKSSFADSITASGRARLLIEAIHDYAIYMLNPDGLVTTWNTGAQRFKGYTEGEVLGTSFSRFYVEEDRNAGLPQRALKTAAAEGKFEAEGWRVRKDGTRFWAHVVIDPIRDPSGELVGFAKITRDLTERREAQRLIDQARDALVQSQKMDAIGQLTGGVAHDFNNLLMAILSGHLLLRKRIDDDPRALLLLDNATQAAQRGVTLTQRMLAFARRQDLKPEQVDISTLVRGMLELLQRSLGSTIQIETNLPFSLERVRLDSNQFEMALLNLAVNARDAMPHGGILRVAGRMEDVEAGHYAKLPAGRYVFISVADNGEGMDPDMLAHAVEPFFTSKGVGKGTGLGLSMVHGLAEQLGGKLVLKSIKGEGTTAEIWLPVADASVSDREVVPRHELPHAPPAHILAVDDDSLVLMSTSFMLEDLGHTVVTASSGKKALELLCGNPGINLVVTDQGMPGMTGVELIKEIRIQWPKIPVILATGYAELPAGVVPEVKLSKPFGQEDLAGAISAAIAAKR